MTTLYLIRHGDAEGNARGRFLGQQDVPLTPHGHWQVGELARKLQSVALAAVYSSDLQRAMQTAQPLAAAHGLQPQPVPALREANFGTWTNLTYTEIAAAWPDAAAAWLADPERMGPPGGESLSTLRTRALQALEAIALAHGGRHVAVVTHGGVLGALLTAWLGTAAWTTPIRNASYLQVERVPAGWQVVGGAPQAFPLPGFRLWSTEETLVLSAPVPCVALSSAVVGGGFRRGVQHVLALHVDKNYMGTDPAADLDRAATGLGLPGDTWLGLMTAVRLQNAVAIGERAGDLSVAALVTAGTGNAAAAGTPPPPFTATPGTINITLAIRARLSPAAMVGAVITATEAKAQALRDLGVQTAAGQIATGTTTDAVVVLATDQGDEALQYAGPATPLGGAIGRATYGAVREALGR